MMKDADIERYASRSQALDLDGIDWDLLRRRPLDDATVRTLRYMADIETHTMIYVRSLLSTRAIDDPDVATFLACWFYEETFHGRGLARVLATNGHATVERRRSKPPIANRIEEAAIRLVSQVWPDFVAVHMAWGAINELTTLTAYQRLAEVADHPVLSEVLARIMRDEARHFAFYYHQAEQRLSRPGTRRVARFLVDRFWAPVGSGVQPDDEVRFIAHHLFSGADGLAAARRVDGTIRRLPGFEGVELIEAYVARTPEVSSPARPAAAA
jgi:hypothetical protein